MRENKKAVIYSRVSTVMQEDRESLKMQMARSEEYCKTQGYEVLESLSDVESGAYNDRKDYLKLKELIREKKFDVLVVYEVSRISRGFTELANFVEELNNSKILFCCISQPELNTNSATGMLFFRMQSTFAEYERELTSKRSKDNKLQRVKLGYFDGGKAPLGYVKVNKKLVVEAEATEKVRDVFNTFVELQSVRATAKVSGLCPTSIRWILKNKTYIGILEFGKRSFDRRSKKLTLNSEFTTVQGIHEPIISKEQFELVQNILEMGSVPNVRKYEYDLLFRGITYCGICGNKLTRGVHNDQRKLTPYFYYSCLPCKVRVNSETMEKQVIKQLLEMEELSKINHYKAEEVKREDIQEKINKKILQLENERKKIINLYTKGFIPDDEMEVELSKIARELERNREELLYTKTTKNKSEEIENLETLKKALKSEKIERVEKNKLFRLLITKITFYKTGRNEYKFDIEL